MLKVRQYWNYYLLQYLWTSCHCCNSLRRRRSRALHGGGTRRRTLGQLWQKGSQTSILMWCIPNSKGQIISKRFFLAEDSSKNQNTSHTSKNELRILGLTICFRNQVTFSGPQNEKHFSYSKQKKSFGSQLNFAFYIWLPHFTLELTILVDVRKANEMLEKVLKCNLFLSPHLWMWKFLSRMITFLGLRESQIPIWMH